MTQRTLKKKKKGPVLVQWKRLSTALWLNVQCDIHKYSCWDTWKHSDCLKQIFFYLCWTVMKSSLLHIAVNSWGFFCLFVLFDIMRRSLCLGLVWTHAAKVLQRVLKCKNTWQCWLFSWNEKRWKQTECCCSFLDGFCLFRCHCCCHFWFLLSL